MFVPPRFPSHESFDHRTTQVRSRRRRITPIATPAAGSTQRRSWSPAAFLGSGFVLERTEALAPSKIRPSAGARLLVLGRYLGPPVAGLRCDVDLGRTFELGQRTLLLTGDTMVLERHARITPRGSDVLIESAPTRGTFVRMQAPQRLCDGDRFRVGRRMLVFRTRTDRRVGLRSHTMAAIEPTAWGRLDVLEGNRIVDTPALAGDEVGIGRDRGGIAFNDDAFVSRTHCRLQRIHGRVMLDDLGSCNGTYLELSPASQALPYGSVLMFGHTLVRIDPIL